MTSFSRECRSSSWVPSSWASGGVTIWRAYFTRICRPTYSSISTQPFLSAWILLLVAQAWFISAKLLDLPRRLDMLGAGLAAAMAVLGLFAGTDASARGFVPPGSRFDPKTFHVIPFFETTTFLRPDHLGFRARPDGPEHKRLILIATIGLLAPAIGCRPFSFVKGPIVLLGLIALLVLLVAGFDLWSRHRIHRATVQGGLFLMVSQQLMIPIGRTAFWHHFAALALKLGRVSADSTCACV